MFTITADAELMETTCSRDRVAKAPPGRAASDGTWLRRVAIVNSTLRCGGAERVITHLADEFAKRRVRTLAVCMQEKGPLGRELQGRGGDVLALESMRGYDLLAAVRLGREFRRFRPQVINVHDLSSLPYALAANCISVRCPVVFTAHGLLYGRSGRGALRHRLAGRFLDAITAVSEQAADRHARYMRWRRKIDILPNGVCNARPSAAKRCEIREELDIPGEAFVFVTVGNARPEKGFEDLLEAAAMLRDAAGGRRIRVIIAGSLGDGRYCKDLLAKRRRLALTDVVKFLGYRSDVEALYLAADAFVLPSRSEGMPMVLLEAMAAGLAVVASDVGGVGEIVGVGAGLLVEGANPRQLSSGMLRLVKEDRLREMLGRRGLARVKNEYSVEKMASRYLETFERVALRGRRRRSRVRFL